MVSLEQASVFLNLNPTEDQGVLIDNLIELVTSEIEAYCDRVLLQDEVIEETLKYSYYDFDLNPEIGFAVRRGQPIIRLKEYPVSDLEITESGVVIDPDDYHLYADIGVIVGKTPFDTRFSNLTATYLAGYDPVPTALQFVALQGVKSYFQDSATAVQGNSAIRSKSLDRFSVSYGNTAQLVGGGGEKTYIASNMTTLNKYKRIDVWG